MLRRRSTRNGGGSCPLATVACLLAIACGRATPVLAASEPDSALAIEIARAGLEGVSASRTGAVLGVSYENRRFRHPAMALGHIARLAGGSDLPPDTVRAIERRLGLLSAAIPFRAGESPDRVIYPGERSFPPPPAGRRWGTSEHSLDFILRPLVAYEVGRIFDPVLIRFELAPELRINPWPGARARASLVIPLRNDFAPDAMHPDINQVRPGASTLDQFLWLRGAFLASACAGVFDDNRYGVSMGLARPVAGGFAWLDAQADLTGYLAFTDSAITYSNPTRWSGFAGFTIRPGSLAAALRVRAQRFLYGDQGLEVQLQRSLGDVDLALYAQRVEGNNIGGVRLALPIPPLDRPVGNPVRAQLAEQFRVEYRNETSVQGTSVSGVASREELVRHLDPSSLRANRHRYLRASGATPREDPARPHEPVSLTGMTGMINTPWCGVVRDGDFEVGFNSISKDGAYDHRGEYRNDIYYGTIGFLPRVEVGFRWTTIPGLKSFQDLVPDSELTDSDRMVSARLEVVPPGPARPGLAVGIEDATGTRRFHATYAVAGMEFESSPLRGRITLGYAPRVLTASRYTLDGAFGAVAVRPWRGTLVTLEHDSEKVNALLGIEAGLGFRARIALLELRHAAVGLGWSHSL